jgi:hypothetical protein
MEKRSPPLGAFFQSGAWLSIKRLSTIFLKFTPSFFYPRLLILTRIEQKSSSPLREFLPHYALQLQPFPLNSTRVFLLEAMNQTERIASLLATGIPHTSVATIVGISPGRVSQLLKEESFQTLLAEKQTEAAEKDTEETNLSAKYLEAEHILLKQVIEMAPVSELRDVTAALRVVAERQEKAKTRTTPILQQSPVYNTIVQLGLPAHAVPELSFGQNREVTAIENRNLAPLGSAGVLGLFNSMRAHTNKQEGDKYEPARTLEEATGSPPEALPSKESIAVGKLISGATKFLDSLHPAPYAGSF